MKISWKTTTLIVPTCGVFDFLKCTLAFKLIVLYVIFFLYFQRWKNIATWKLSDIFSKV